MVIIQGETSITTLHLADDREASSYGFAPDIVERHDMWDTSGTPTTVVTHFGFGSVELDLSIIVTNSTDYNALMAMRGTPVTINSTSFFLTVSGVEQFNARDEFRLQINLKAV